MITKVGCCVAMENRPTKSIINQTALGAREKIKAIVATAKEQNMSSQIHSMVGGNFSSLWKNCGGEISNWHLEGEACGSLVTR